MGRILITTDNHGALKAVKQVLERCNFNPNKDLLINLGDVVDRGTESAELVQFYIELSEECLYKPLFIKGNHDDYCQKWLKSGEINMEWLMNGGTETIDSYIRTGYLDSEVHLDFFNEMFDFYIDTKNRGYVHAGFISHSGLGHDNPNIYYWDRTLWELALLSNENKELSKEMRIYGSHKEIFIGHTPTLNWGETEPMNKCNIWNLDTGAGFGGKITILDATSKEFWQSDTVEDLYTDNRQ
ncbi:MULTISPECIES: metallophosphoesterase [Chryseobacterium]|uniref:Serine/threonine protein phosphatase 1 n=1 Tax=Chryseobacterium geocarposphaerae TaxID=1416776 RepID=A0ABU1LHA4_9FLAO|nr:MULTISPECIES: metallophosphoesterase [Chryseobacterium]MDR6406106.1 serine/threonine protein phosphatase 1 [Chryseobacterium geocarposphaerae]MDR6699420.1 serine/threonine protein phosphatase 1 [Chryseobacterium ginsenosidimutans]